MSEHAVIGLTLSVMMCRNVCLKELVSLGVRNGLARGTRDEGVVFLFESNTKRQCNGEGMRYLVRA